MATLGTLALLGQPSSGQAGGFILPNTGAKASSMVGAWVAQGDDLSVMDHNPAQLVRQDQYGVELHYTAFVFSGTYQPDPVAGLGSGPASSNVGDFVNHIPNVYGSFPLHERFTLGVGIFSPIGPSHTYSDGGAQRYQVQQSTVQLAWGTVAGAYRILDNLAASLSLDVGVASAEQKMALGLIPGYHSLDGNLLLEAAGGPIPRAKLGVLYHPADDISIGLVAAHGVDLRLQGEIQAAVPQVGFDPATARDDVTVTQRYPSEARLAVGWTPEPFRAEVALRYYRWSEYDAQRIELATNQIGGITIDDMIVEQHYRDTLAIQLGGGYRFADVHEVRAGYMFDQQANLDPGVTISDFDAPKHVLGLGYGLTFADNYYTNLSFNQIFYQDRHVTDSATEAVSVMGESPALGNGTYTWSVQTVAMQLGARF